MEYNKTGHPWPKYVTEVIWDLKVWPSIHRAAACGTRVPCKIQIRSKSLDLWFPKPNFSLRNRCLRKDIKICGCIPPMRFLKAKSINEHDPMQGAMNPLRVSTHSTHGTNNGLLLKTSTIACQACGRTHKAASAGPALVFVIPTNAAAPSTPRRDTSARTFPATWSSRAPTHLPTPQTAKQMNHYQTEKTIHPSWLHTVGYQNAYENVWARKSILCGWQ